MGKRTPFQMIKKMMEFDKAPKSYSNVPYNSKDWEFLLGPNRASSVEMDPLLYIDDENPFIQEYARSLVTGSETKPRKSFKQYNDGSWKVTNCLDGDKNCYEYVVHTDGNIGYRNWKKNPEIFEDEFEYDANGNLVKAAGERYEWDDKGRPVYFRLENPSPNAPTQSNKPAKFIWADDGRSARVEFSDGSGHTRYYDDKGNLISAGDNAYEYDGNGNLISESWRGGPKTVYEYDDKGNLINVRDQYKTRDQRSDYNENGYPETVSAWWGNARFFWDPFGNVIGSKTLK